MPAQAVKDVMTDSPLELQKDATLVEAAMAMAGGDIGTVLVLDGKQLTGIVTDRDIVVRGVALSLDPTTTPLSSIVSEELVTLSPDDPVDRAVTLAREKAIRRFPVVSDSSVVGVLSLGDLARDRDPDSTLADISAAPPNT